MTCKARWKTSKVEAATAKDDTPAAANTDGPTSQPSKKRGREDDDAEAEPGSPKKVKTQEDTIAGAES